jgi:prepilin-type N-terminal cleavage/methylation domain-containing protein/prepilin-type processing-associated H-X9-DG protein
LPEVTTLQKKAFTLIELLVVIAIIAILAAILFPVFAQAKAAAKKSVSLSNQKQIGTGVILYSSDYDDMLPETGWNGPCSFPGTATTNNNAFSGVQSFLTGIFPYTKNWQIISCPSDPDKGVFGKPNEGCFEQMFLAAGVPGAYAGMATVNNGLEFVRVLPASYAGNYMLMPAYLRRSEQVVNGGAGWTGARGRNLSQISTPANMFFSTDVGSTRVNGLNFSGWYTVPGYGNLGNGTGRWERGQRHNGGRNWTFADGHAKYQKELAYVNANGSTKSIRQLVWEYQQAGIFTYWETESREYCQFPTAEVGCDR